jgi:hypothetical protein
LDYGEIRRSAADMEIEMSRCLWDKIRALEAAALTAGKKGPEQ